VGLINQIPAAQASKLPKTLAQQAVRLKTEPKLLYSRIRTNACSEKTGAINIVWKSLMKALAISLSFLIACPALSAQTIPTQLNIVVIEGEGAVNNIRQRVARDPVVQVEDENHRPIAGAVVMFTLPTEGATGEFGGSVKSTVVNTNAEGRAVAPNLKFNGISGKIPIHITASYRGLSARASITMFSQVPPGAKESKSGGGHGTMIAVLAILGAGAAGGGVYFATQGNKAAASSAPIPTGPTPIGITAGTGSIAGGK
jgi:hypothetical protein